MSEPIFIDWHGRQIAPESPAPNIFLFTAMMATVVANRRGGVNSQYLRECADFMTDVVGRVLSIRDPLPEEYDWRPAAAVECANAMMEYDS